MLKALRYHFIQTYNNHIINHYKQFSIVSCRFFSTSLESNKLYRLTNVTIRHPQVFYPLNSDYLITTKRNYSKKKKSSKKFVEQEDTDSEDEGDYESLEADEIGDDYNTMTKSVPSMRIDTIAKAAFGISKKKIEKEFYASNLRLNGIKILKKSTNVSEGDEIDIIKETSPENEKFLLVNRAIVKSVGRISATGNFPVKLQAFKSLTIENYADDPWKKSATNDSL